MRAKPGKKTLMPLSGDGADCSEETTCRKHGHETQPDQRSGLETAGLKIRVVWFDRFVETGNLLPKLGADAAHQQIPKTGHPTQHHCWTTLAPPIRLGQEGQNDVALLHCFTSAAE